MCNKLKLIKSFTCVFIALCFILAVSSPGIALTGPQISVRVGFDGKGKLGGINPVFLTLKTDAKVYGILKVIVGDKIYAHPINLEADTIKEYHFSIPFLSGQEKITVQVEEKGSILASEEIHPELMSANAIFIGVLSDSPETLYHAKDIKSELFVSEDINIFPLKLKESAYSLNELENLNFIFLDDFNTASLDLNDQDLLKNWVNAGNMLLAGQGIFSYKTITGFLKDLNEPQYWGEGVAISVNETLRDMSSEQLSMMIEEYITPRGIAKILDAQDIYSEIFESRKLYFAADSTIVPTPQKLYFLIILLLAYVILVGISIIVQRDSKAFFTFTVLLFSGIFYTVALSGGLGKIPISGAAVNLVGDNKRSCGLLSLYPHKETNGVLKTQLDNFTYPLDDFQFEMDPIEKQVDFCTDQNIHFYYSSIEDWIVQPLSLQVNDDGVLVGKLKNPMANKMTNCLLLLGDTSIEIGEMDGKEELEVKYKLDHNLKGMGEYNYLSTLYKQAGLDGVEQQLLDYYHYNLTDVSTGGRLLGFSIERAKLKFQGKDRIVNIMTLNVIPVKLDHTQGKVNIPNEVIKPLLGKRPLDDSLDNREIILKKGEEVKVYFSIPFNIEPEEINIYYQEDLGNIKVLNRRKGNWEDISSNILSRDLLKDMLYKGPLTLSLKGTSRTMIPQISVKGRIISRNNGGL